MKKATPTKKTATRTRKPRVVIDEMADVPKEVFQKAEDMKEKTEETKVSSVVTAPSMKRVLYAVDSFAQDDRIKADSEDPWKKVTVLVKDKYSNANVDKYLKSGSLRLITTFATQFENEDYDVAFIEGAMMEFVPEKILKKLNN